MSKAELEQLEREAEAARARLVGGLARLRSNDQLTEIKERVTADVTDAKSELIGNAKGAVRGRADGMLAEIKARVAANPGAALAIGAGLAWRLYRHPPVTSMLVGAGLMALMRTDPERPAMGADMAARAADFAGTARDRVQAFRDGDPAGQMRDRAGTAREQVGALAETARERAAEFGSEAGRRAKGAMYQAARTADRWTASGKRAVAGAIPDSDRDRYLMGAAALALAAAVGIAAQRRAGESGTDGRMRRFRGPGAGYRSPDIVGTRRRHSGSHPGDERGRSAISS